MEYHILKILISFNLARTSVSIVTVVFQLGNLRLNICKESKPGFKSRLSDSKLLAYFNHSTLLPFASLFGNGKGIRKQLSNMR